MSIFSLQNPIKYIVFLQFNQTVFVPNLLTTYCTSTNLSYTLSFLLWIPFKPQQLITDHLQHCYKNLNDKFVYKHKEINSIEFETRDAYSCLLTMLRLINWFPPRHFLIGYWAPGATRIAVSTSPIHAGWIGYYVSSQQLDKSSHNTWKHFTLSFTETTPHRIFQGIYLPVQFQEFNLAI